MRINKSWRTAISRHKISKPMHWLMNCNLIGEYSLLDFGCGRGTDVNFLKLLRYNRTVGYDPHFFPVMPNGCFDVVTCIYVLNVIPDPVERANILAEAQSYVRTGGNIYVAIRADKSNLKGWTRNDTWQGYVADTLECLGFEQIHQGQFEIWVTRNT